jgi:hypothetical protein
MPNVLRIKVFVQFTYGLHISIKLQVYTVYTVQEKGFKFVPFNMLISGFNNCIYSLNLLVQTIQMKNMKGLCREIFCLYFFTKGITGAYRHGHKSACTFIVCALEYSNLALFLKTDMRPTFCISKRIIRIYEKRVFLNFE